MLNDDTLFARGAENTGLRDVPFSTRSVSFHYHMLAVCATYDW
jgi:hypothetical protein